MKKINKIFIISLCCVLMAATFFLDKDLRTRIFLNFKIVSKSKTMNDEKKKDTEKSSTIITNQEQLYDPEIITEKQKEILKVKITNWIVSNYPKSYKRLAQEIADYLVNESKIPLLMLGLIGAESSFRIQLRNEYNAIGLCQVRYFIWKKEAPEIMKKFKITSLSELYDPIKNIKMGEYILLRYMSDTRDIQKALCKYHTGKNSLDLLSPRQKIRTKEYINNVFKICGQAYISLSLKIIEKTGYKNTETKKESQRKP